MLTPQKIQDLADPIESIYIAMTNELLVNIGRHITKPTWTHTAAWEIQKLSELGQLTQENAAIINRWIKSLPQEIRDTMEETRREALEDIEKQMENAAQAGYLTPPERDSTVTVLQEYSQQAADQLNLVNTTMLQSSLQQYSRMVQLTAEIERQAEQTQAILNEAAGSVASGTETRTQALNRAIRRISEEGLTGFYDKAGRSWSPEAYVNMDIRTTVHNVAIQSVKNRMEDYNTQVFQVSAHAAARPLCYPYQGKLYSWDNTAGEIETGTGRMMQYAPLNSTSYGEPAGLFGINCGHYPIPIIPGVTIPHAQDFVQPKDENDRQYAESQQQRALERKIRAAKRALEMGDSSPEAKARVRAAQSEMRQFIKETGRTRRPDREQLYGGKKAPTPPKDQRPEKNVASQATKTKIEPVKVEFGEAVDGIRRNKYRDSVKQALENAPDEVKKAWNMVSADLKAPNFDINDGAYFSPGSQSVHFETQKKAFLKSTYQEDNACYFHEYGHNIDFILGGKQRGTYLSGQYKNGAFGKTLYAECEKRIKEFYYNQKGFKDDFEAVADRQNGPGGMGAASYFRQLLRSIMPGDEYRAVRSDLLAAGDDLEKLRPYYNKHLKGTEAFTSEIRSMLHQKQIGTDFCDYVKKNYSIFEVTDVSDMFNQYTLVHYGIGYPFGVGHRNDYWGNGWDYDALEKEAFAEMFSATATQNKSLGAIKEFFPESYALFTEMLKEATK